MSSPKVRIFLVFWSNIITSEDLLHQADSTPVITKIKNEDRHGWDMCVECPQVHYPRRPYAGQQMEGVGRDAERQHGGGQCKGK